MCAAGAAWSGVTAHSAVRLPSTLLPLPLQFQFPEDIARIYETRHRVPADRNEVEGKEDEKEGPREDELSYQDLFMQCEQRCKTSGWQRFTSKDPFVRALTGGSAMIYQVRLAGINICAQRPKPGALGLQGSASV